MSQYASAADESARQADVDRMVAAAVAAREEEAERRVTAAQQQLQQVRLQFGLLYPGVCHGESNK